ncbi:MAG: hypothetical protein WAX89_02505 [Alphaproteobacteria bacterium]
MKATPFCLTVAMEISMPTQRKRPPAAVAAAPKPWTVAEVNELIARRGIYFSSYNIYSTYSHRLVWRTIAEHVVLIEEIGFANSYTVLCPEKITLRINANGVVEEPDQALVTSWFNLAKKIDFLERRLDRFDTLIAGQRVLHEELGLIKKA